MQIAIWTSMLISGQIIENMVYIYSVGGSSISINRTVKYFPRAKNE